MIKRRDILMLGGGSIAALPLTPIPYKLLDDVSIWTQNWPWIPVPKAGEITVRNSVCTLCRGGCPIQVRCVDGRPISVLPKRTEPASASPACALAFGSHQLPWHPARLRKCLLNGKPAAADEVSAAVAEACTNAGSSIAILDERPGRAMSALYRRFAGTVKGGVYVTPPMQERATLDATAALCGTKSRLGFDWSKTSTVLSIGAPLLDGFAGASQLAGRRAKGEVRLFHAGSSFSRQAQLAERFFPVLPGSEAAFALSLANVLIESVPATAAGLAEFKAMTSQFPLERAAAVAGLKPETIRQLAADLAAGAPAVVVGGGEFASGPFGAETETLIAALNVLLGSVGAEGGIRPYAGSDPLSGSTPLDKLPDHSVAVLITDRAIAGFVLPWSLIERKLTKDAVVVALSSWHRDLAARARSVVAVPAPMEDWTECASTAQPGYALAPAVLKRPEGTVRADEFLASVAGRIGVDLAEGFDLETALKGRAEEIHAGRRGSVGGQKTTEFASGEDVWKALSEGSEWIDSEPSTERLKASLPGARPGEADCLLAAATKHGSATTPADFPLALIATGWIGGAGSVRLPLAGILDKESLLRRPPGRAAIHPSTAANLGLKSGEQVQLETPKGQRRMVLDVDDAVLPGSVEAAVEAADGNSALDLFEAGADGTWRLARARMRRA